MALIRFILDLAIPEAVYNGISPAKRVAIRDMIRELRAYAVKINAGADNEEMTVNAKWHRCLHDTGGKCEDGQDI